MFSQYAKDSGGGGVKELGPRKECPEFSKMEVGNCNISTIAFINIRP
jgi:hypothetical protein